MNNCEMIRSRQYLLQEVVSLLDNDDAVEKLYAYVNELKLKMKPSTYVSEPPCQYGERQMLEHLRNAEDDFNENRMIDHDDFIKELDSW